MLPTAQSGGGADDYVRSRSQPPIFVLNTDYRIELAPVADGSRRIDPATAVGMRLSGPFETAVRRLTAAWDARDEATLIAGVAMVGPSFVVRTAPLRGDGGVKIAVTVERLRTRNAIDQSARRFGLTPRECEVLALVLEGAQTRQVADSLGIAPSTATDHVKRLLAKTHSHNRAELVARALGWKNEAERTH